MIRPELSVLPYKVEVFIGINIRKTKNLRQPKKGARACKSWLPPRPYINK